MNSTARFQEPGFWTWVVHVLVICSLAVLLAPLALLRLVVSPAAEILIRAADGVHDALVERLSQ